MRSVWDVQALYFLCRLLWRMFLDLNPTREANELELKIGEGNRLITETIPNLEPTEKYTPTLEGRFNETGWDENTRSLVIVSLYFQWIGGLLGHQNHHWWGFYMLLNKINVFRAAFLEIGQSRVHSWLIKGIKSNPNLNGKPIQWRWWQWLKVDHLFPII